MRLLKKDDFVVLEYGLDDEGDPQNKPKNGSLNLRASLPGTGDETVTVRYEVIDTVQLPNGTTQVVKGSARNVTEVVHTFGWYLKNMIVDVRDQEAHVIISSRIPNNWETVKAAGNKTIDTLATEYKLRDYAQKVAEEIKAEFVDHTYYTLRYLQELGPVESKKLYGYRPEPGQEIEKKLYTNVKGAKGMADSSMLPDLALLHYLHFTSSLSPTTTLRPLLPNFASLKHQLSHQYFPLHFSLTARKLR